MLDEKCVMGVLPKCFVICVLIRKAYSDWREHYTREGNPAFLLNQMYLKAVNPEGVGLAVVSHRCPCRQHATAAPTGSSQKRRVVQQADGTYSVQAVSAENTQDEPNHSGNVYPLDGN